MITALPWENKGVQITFSGFDPIRKAAFLEESLQKLTRSIGAKIRVVDSARALEILIRNTVAD